MVMYRQAQSIYSDCELASCTDYTSESRVLVRIFPICKGDVDEIPREAVYFFGGFGA